MPVEATSNPTSALAVEASHGGMSGSGSGEEVESQANHETAQAEEYTTAADGNELLLDEINARNTSETVALLGGLEKPDAGLEKRRKRKRMLNCFRLTIHPHTQAYVVSRLMSYHWLLSLCGC